LLARARAVGKAGESAREGGECERERATHLCRCQQ
jgi:hypothetical protein